MNSVEYGPLSKRKNSISFMLEKQGYYDDWQIQT